MYFQITLIPAYIFMTLILLLLFYFIFVEGILAITAGEGLSITSRLFPLTKFGICKLFAIPNRHKTKDAPS